MSTRSLDYLLASASGVLLALSFPRYGHPAFSWIALAPLLLTLARPESRVPNPKSLIPNPDVTPLRRAFVLGVVSGVVYFTGTLYWITRVMIVYGGLQPWVAVLVNAALIAYLALFPGIFALVTRRLTILFSWRGVIAAPLVWVATELGRTHVLTGFPWALLGYSQVTVLPIAQIASLFGVYGVSALVASVSAAAVVALDRRWTPAVVVALTLVVAAAWGSMRIAAGDLTRAGDPVRVGLIQGNVEQAEKTEPARADQIFNSYLTMTRQAIGHGAELVIWPESSTPFMFEEEAAAADRVRAIARQARVPILLGSDQLERSRPDKYYNSAFLVRSDGTTGGVYRKMHLVPFGEYVPLRRLLFFAAPLVEAVGAGFFAGERAELLPVDGHIVSAAICYEIVYPDLVRGFVREGSQLVTTITNDAWFGRTSAPYQHFAQAAMRAIEEGRYLVRSANTGISGIVDPYGRVLFESALYEQTVIVGQARYLGSSTFYQRHGDVFAYACVVLTIAMLAMSRRRVQ